MGYRVPAGHGQAEFIEKRSRFIGQVRPVNAETEARELIAKTKAMYHDARHNCWCYIIRDGELVRYADDGEPQGTAGQPMLEVFRRGGIENVVCVVTRYFGGILLGAGGLTRAYANTAKLALDDAGIAEMRLWTAVGVVCPYHLFDRIKKEIETFGGISETVDYGADISFTALFPEGTADPFLARINELSSGTVTGSITGTTYRI
jgi:uncharacterized YigZ family protein